MLSPPTRGPPTITLTHAGYRTNTHSLRWPDHPSGYELYEFHLAGWRGEEERRLWLSLDIARTTDSYVIRVRGRPQWNDATPRERRHFSYQSVGRFLPLYWKDVAASLALTEAPTLGSHDSLRAHVEIPLRRPELNRLDRIYAAPPFLNEPQARLRYRLS